MDGWMNGPKFGTYIESRHCIFRKDENVIRLGQFRNSQINNEHRIIVIPFLNFRRIIWDLGLILQELVPMFLSNLTY